MSTNSVAALPASSGTSGSGSEQCARIFHLVIDRKLQLQGVNRDLRIFIAQGSGIPSDETRYKCFDSSELEYIGFCDDFGPMNASCMVKFISMLQSQLLHFHDFDIVYCSDAGKRNFTNSVFLLGSYMILILKEPARDVWSCFSNIQARVFEPYRDATFSESRFDLTLLDCWEGLERGRDLGWLTRPTSPGVWGQVILEEYDHYEDPLNGDLHMVVPGLFVAFKGPMDLPGGSEYRDARGTRDFSPCYYVDIFHEIKVRAVVRLNEPLYDEGTFEQAGIRHFDLEFPDCTCPPDDVVARFFRIVDQTAAAGGLVAVHCKAGLGRTGTLIALELMRRHGFSAREAMGWLRIMRPGSVIGDQQHYLCDVERAASRALGRGEYPDFSAALVAAARVVYRQAMAAGEQSEALGRQVADAMDRRAAERIRGR